MLHRSEEGDVALTIGVYRFFGFCLLRLCVKGMSNEASGEASGEARKASRETSRALYLRDRLQLPTAFVLLFRVKKILPSSRIYGIITYCQAKSDPLAQLGERLGDNQKVTSSSLVRVTSYKSGK